MIKRIKNAKPKVHVQNRSKFADVFHLILIFLLHFIYQILKKFNQVKVSKRTIITYTIVLIFSISSLMAQEMSPIADLPLQVSLSRGNTEVLVIYITGDGGWNSFNQQMVQELEKDGYGVVALNSRKYFWSEKSPDTFARAIEKLSNYYLEKWKKSSLIIVGYSFGADVASFLPNRVSAELLHKIKKIALISPSASTDFVIKLSDLVSESENVNRKYKVGPEINQVLIPFVCTFGNDEEKALKNTPIKNKDITVKKLPGDHRYNYDFSLLTKTIGL